MIQRDWLLRLLEEIANFVARSLGLAKDGRHEEARRELERGYASLGLSRDTLDRFDVNTLRTLAGDRIPALVRLIEADIEIARLAGDPTAVARRERIASLLR